MSMNVIELKNVGIKFKIARSKASRFKDIAYRIFKGNKSSVEQIHTFKEFWAIRNISFTLKKGEALGIIGRNGAGKSTLLRVIAGIYSPDEGECKVQGNIGLLQLGVGFHHELSGRDNIYISAAILGLKKGEIDRIYDDIVEFSELGDFIDMPIKVYSSGMVARLGFSISMHLKPDILLVDEVLAVGDEDFKRKSRQKIGEFREMGKTIIMVSHNIRELKTLCERTIFLENGRIGFDGSTADAEKLYMERIAEKKQRRKALREIRKMENSL